jgi:hypothetical protein
MKKSIFVLMVCLMATAGAYASKSWVGPTGSWGTATLWQTSAVPVDADGEVKIIKTSATSCTLDSDIGSFTTLKTTISGNGGLTFNIVTGGKMMTAGEFTVGCGTAGSGVPTGIVNQTGGQLTLNNTGNAASGKLEIGYKSGSAGVGNGTYTISGGTIDGSGGIYVGAFAGTGTGGSSGAIGKLVVSGTGGTISVGGPLFVGEGDATSAWKGTGTLQFNVDGGVSAITTSSVTLNLGAAGAVANLLVNLTGAAATGNIVLVNNTGAGAVTGIFDNAAWTNTVMVGSDAYYLSNVYDAATGQDGIGNDIALVVPEPATIALINLGLLAIRRKK